MPRALKWAGIVIGSLAGLFILLLILVGIFGSDANDNQADTSTTEPTSAPHNSETATTPHPTATQLPTPPPTIMVTANALGRQYEANKVYWEDKYVDKYALITGSISFISETRGQYDVKLRTNNPFINIVCKISSAYKSSVLNLAVEETISIYGLVTNDGIIDIVVRDCVVRLPNLDQANGLQPSVVSEEIPTRNPTATPNFFEQYEGMAKNVAVITVYIGTPTGSGSGFLYRIDDSEGFGILTNRHVVQDYSSVEVCWALTQGCVYEQVQDRGSENFDVAVVEFSKFLEHVLDTETFQWFASWYETNIANTRSGNSDWAKGDVVYASGYPGGHKVQGTNIISDPVVTEGIIVIDGLSSYRNAYFIEHGANIEPGSSGGPLLNSAAHIIGINTGTNLFAEQLELAIPMTNVIEWMETGEEPSLTRRTPP